MDRITASLLSEFSRDHGLEGLSEDKQFEHFTSYLAVNRHHGETFDTADIVTGAGNDSGIDGLAIIVNGSLVDEPEEIDDFLVRDGYLDVSFIFVQAERSSSFETAKIGQFSFGVLDLFKERPSLPHNAAIQNSFTVANFDISQ